LSVALSGVHLAGITSVVPERIVTSADDARIFGEALAKRISDATGVMQRYVVSNNTCTSDLAYAAAEELLTSLAWRRDSIDTLIFVSQTPDYVLPASACVLQARLKLSTRCAAFDVNLGCSGYIYGLWLASNLISAGSASRVLLLAGDTTSRFVSPEDRAVAPLFGDAATATAIERREGALPAFFELGTDGRGEKHAIVRGGGFRNPRSKSSALRTEREGGSFRSEEELAMNGAAVFAFTLREVPRMITATLKSAGWSLGDVDAFVLHQANRSILEHLVKRLQLPPDKVLLTVQHYGNTSSASIPLAMTHSLSERLTTESMRLLMVSFGNGFSWGASAITCGPMLMSPLKIWSAAELAQADA